MSARRQSQVVAGRGASVLSRENAVIAGCVLLALPAAFVVDGWAAAPTWTWMAVFFLVGIGLPQVLNRSLDRRSGDDDG